MYNIVIFDSICQVLQQFHVLHKALSKLLAFGLFHSEKQQISEVEVRFAVSQLKMDILLCLEQVNILLVGHFQIYSRAFSSALTLLTITIRAILRSAVYVTSFTPPVDGLKTDHIFFNER